MPHSNIVLQNEYGGMYNIGYPLGKAKWIHGVKRELLAEYTMQALNDKLQLHPSYPRDSTTPTPTTTPNNSQTIPDTASEEMSTAL